MALITDRRTVVDFSHSSEKGVGYSLVTNLR